MTKKKTPEDYYNECKLKGIDLPIEDYINARTKLTFKCKYNHIYEQLPSNHLRGYGCPKCKNIKLSISKKKTPEDYYNECKSKGLDLPVEDYINNKTKIKHKCSKGHIYKQYPSSHLNSKGCPICIVDNQRKTPEQYYNECKLKELDLPIEDYVTAHVKIKHRCSNCGNIYEQTPSHHLHGHGCPVCSGNKLQTPKEYHDKCAQKELDLPIENYISNKTKIKHRCSKGHIYEQTPSNHLQGYGCPICNESHGEKFIRNYLDKHNIKYEPQKKFYDLKDKTYLSYDFYLPNYNILIEYQGVQHYESISFNGKDYSNLEKQQYHDKLKRNYAKENGYKLLELHYSLDTQDKVDKYLSRRIKG